jgi:hypothetical protein
MTKLKPKRPSTGTVLGFIALMVALAGNANALSSHIVVRKGDIAKGAVTAKALAAGAVKKRAIAKGAVTSKALAAGAVGASALAQDAVTANAVAPESIHGYALGPVVVHGKTIADLDAVAENGTWTSSNTEVATCGVGEHLLTGGIVFTNPGNREVGVIESIPVINSGSNAWIGQMTSNSGGLATAEVQAICLK